MQNNNSIGDIAVGVLAGALNGVDRLISEPFWTHYQTKVVSSRLLLPKYWNEDPLKNLGEIFTEALGKPISRKLRIKQDEYLYVNRTSSSSIQSITNSDIRIFTLLKDDYKTFDNGSIQYEINKFPIAGTDKQLRTFRITILKKKPEYADTVFGDSCIIAESLLSDADSTTNFKTVPKIIYSVTSATGEFEGVQGLEVQNSTDGKRKIVLRWNGEL